MNKKKKLWLAAVALVLAVMVLVFACSGPEEPGPVETGGTVTQFADLPEFHPVRGTFAFAGMFNDTVDTEAEYAYSDEYFTLDSTIYNPSLSTMSLCLELSSWSSYETEVWAEKSKNAEALLTEIGFTDFAQNEFWEDKPSVTSIGAVAARKQLEDSTLIALAVRGGGYYSEWGSNVTVGAEGEHTGFAEGRDNVIRFLEDFIRDNDITGRVKIWLVGYSRGGAVANMTAGYLNQNPLPNGAELAHEDLYCYAFAPPRGVLESEAGEDADHSNIHNVINANDIVPLVAPTNWEFTRYNSTPHLLPTITTVGFEEQLERMLIEYEEILEGVEVLDPESTEYGIPEYAKKIQVDVDPLNFLPSGEPFVDISIVDDTRQTQSEMLNAFVTAFIAHVDGRDQYYSILESDLIRLLDDLMGYESEMDFEEILDSFAEAMTGEPYENLKYVLAPVWEISSLSTEERIKEVVSRIHEVVPQPEGYSDLYGTAAAVVQVMGSMAVNNGEELLDLILAFADSRMMQAHYPEFTLAWVRSQDPHYTELSSEEEIPEALRVIRVNGPVNVKVYDSHGNLVAEVTDLVCTSYHGVVGCAINADGEIVIHLPSDEAYRIEFEATGDGLLNLTLGEFNAAHSAVTRLLNYRDIGVNGGDVLTMIVPDLTQEEYSDAACHGSTADYRLLGKGDQQIPCQRESRGGEVSFFDITVSQNNPYGVVLGGGQYLDGSFVRLEAKPLASGSFEGWYVDGTKVSDEAVYRFPADADLTVVAHFSEVPMYSLQFRTSGAGTVANVNKAYSAGSTVQLSAEAADGFVFDHWETTAGTIADAASAQTTITVTDSSAVITAVFRSTTQETPKAPETPEASEPETETKILCPSCGQEVASTQSHAAPCGVNGHYTCDGQSHDAAVCGTGGHYSCDGTDHAAASCGNDGHFNCDDLDHTAAVCGVEGHYTCYGDHGEVTLTDPTMAELQEALSGCCTIVNVTGSAALSEAVAIESGKTLNLVDAAVEIAQGVTLTNQGSIQIDAGSTLTNYGDITGGTDSELLNEGTFDNRNTAFDPSSLPFYQNGTYLDARTDELYLLVTDSRNLIAEWDTMSNVVGQSGDSAGLGWVTDHTYTVYGAQTITEDSSGVDLTSIQGTESLTLTLDLNGRTVLLDNEGLYISDVADIQLTITDRSGGTGVLQSSGVVLRTYNAGLDLLVENVELHSTNPNPSAAVIFNGTGNHLRFVQATVRSDVGSALSSTEGISNDTTIELESSLLQGGTDGYGFQYFYFGTEQTMSVTIDGTAYDFETIQNYAGTSQSGFAGGLGAVYFYTY